MRTEGWHSLRSHCHCRQITAHRSVAQRQALRIEALEAQLEAQQQETGALQQRLNQQQRALEQLQEQLQAFLQFSAANK